MIAAYISAWKRAFDYAGRTSRSDFWWFVLLNFIVSLILTGIGLAVAFGFSVDVLANLSTLYSMASVVPSIPLVVRRLRDSGKHWAWLFINLVPCIGPFWLIYLLVQPTLLG